MNKGFKTVMTLFTISGVATFLFMFMAQMSGFVGGFCVFLTIVASIAWIITAAIAIMYKTVPEIKRDIDKANE